MTDRWSRRDWLQAGVASAALPWGGSNAWGAGKKTAAAGLTPVVKGALASPSQPPVWAEWESFKKQFVSDTGRVSASDPEGPRTYSEGQSYALFFALVANDRVAFDAILQWTENNLCGGDLTVRLPAWLWGKRADGEWGVIDSNPASDADLWIAYALGEAGRLWNVRRYQALSALLAARVLREETAALPGLGVSLLPAPTGFQEGPDSWRLNPSYMPLQIMHWLAASEPGSPWGKVADSSLQIVLRSAPKGFSPDWTVYSPSQGFGVYTQGNKGQGTYNAIRVYTWAGMLHPQAAGASDLLIALRPMARFVQEKGYPPESIDILTGQENGPAASGFSAALLPFLHSVGEKEALKTQLLRMQARPLRPDAYYEQVLALFGKGWMDGWFRFGPFGHLQPRWMPQ